MKKRKLKNIKGGFSILERLSFASPSASKSLCVKAVKKAIENADKR